MSSRPSLKNWTAGPFGWRDLLFTWYFYRNVVYNTIPLNIIRTSIKWSIIRTSKSDPGMMCSIDKTTFFCWISKFLEAPPDMQVITVFSPSGLNLWFLPVSLKVLQFENLDFRNGMFSLIDWEFTKYVVPVVISLFADLNNFLGVRICSEKGLCKLAGSVNLFKVPATHK